MRVRQCALFASKPNAERAPPSHNRHRDVTDRAQTETERLHPAIRPRSKLVAAAITERIDETLGFVLILARQNREQYFTRGSHERERAGATSHLKYCQDSKHWHETHRSEAEQTERRHE